jgi:hypothetical protein
LVAEQQYAPRWACFGGRWGFTRPADLL